MTADIEQIKKKIIYRSNYRGTKEMDKLLGAFTRKYLNKLNMEDLNQLIKLLEIDRFVCSKDQDQKKFPWQKSHKPNLTGTDNAYHPKKSENENKKYRSWKE